MSNESQNPEDLRSVASEPTGDPASERRMQEALAERRRQREQAELADATLGVSSAQGVPIGEEVMDDETIPDPHTDLPEPLPEGADDDDATQRRLQEAVDAGKRRREKAEIE